MGRRAWGAGLAWVGDDQLGVDVHQRAVVALQRKGVVGCPGPVDAQVTCAPTRSSSRGRDCSASRGVCCTTNRLHSIASQRCLSRIQYGTGFRQRSLTYHRVVWVNQFDEGRVPHTPAAESERTAEHLQASSSRQTLSPPLRNPHLRSAGQSWCSRWPEPSARRRCQRPGS